MSPGRHGTASHRSFECETLPLLAPLFVAAAQMTRDRGEAENLVCRTYVRALSEYQGAAAGADPRTSMFRILVGMLVPTRSEEQRPSLPDPCANQAVSGTPEGVWRRASGLCEPTGRELERLPDSEVSVAIDRLPMELRLVVYLADVEGFSRTDIGKIIGIPPSSVTSRLHEGHRRLLRELALTVRRHAELG